jgi:hypothetical protein
MALTRTEDKTDKAIARLLLQNPMGLTIGDITATAKCTPQTARKSLARIGAEKDASGMLYVLRDDDEPAPVSSKPDPVSSKPAPTPLTGLQQRVLDLLSQHRGLTAQRIADDLHEPLDGVLDALLALGSRVTSRPLALPEIQVWGVVG